MKVLVAYASKYGATKGIAERIGEGLKRRGLEVDVSECKDIRDESGYDAYVVGSAAYAFNWRKDARKFVTRNAEVLAAHPVWLFSSGPLGTETVDKDGNDVLEGAEPKQFAEYEDLIYPRGRQVFRGAYHHDQIRGGTGSSPGCRRSGTSCPRGTSASGRRSTRGPIPSPRSWVRRLRVPEGGCRIRRRAYTRASSSRMPATNASMSSSLVSNEHIQRTSPFAAFQS